MGIPITKFIWDDQTIKAPVAEVDTLAGKPILMTACSSDKGPEEFRTFDNEYIERYGDISFARHGQAQIQLGRILNAGGAVYHKRIVAPDSTLANLSLVATTNQITVQKVDSTGAKLYLNADGEETTVAEGNEPIMLNRAGIKYDVVVVDDLSTLIKIGNDPKAIAEIVRKNIELENANAVNPDIPVVDRDTPDDLATMGHTTATVTLDIADLDGDGIDDYKADITLVCDAANISRCAVYAHKASTIADFNMNAATFNDEDNVLHISAANVQQGNNTLYVEYDDPENYPAELYNINIDESNVVTITTTLDKSALKALVRMYQTIINEDYTEATWNAFSIALTAAVLALDDDKDAQAASDCRVELKYTRESLITNKVFNTVPKKYLLWTITDTGRGESAKRVIITPNYQASKNSAYTKYLLTVMEGTNSTDRTMMFSMNPDIIDQKANRRLDSVVKANSMQLRCITYENIINTFFDDIATKAGVSVATIKQEDVLFGCDRKGKHLDYIMIDTSSVIMNSGYGMALRGGTNGSFGVAPMDSEAYIPELRKVFNGTYIDIYDLDNVTIHAIFDCGMPIEVKHDIESLVAFREDCFYFRDLGVGLTTFEDIAFVEDQMMKSKFCASYHNSYDVYDEFTLKQITVTCMYHLAPAFVNHYDLGVNRPFSGYLHGLVFDDVIENTVNYIPVKCPGDDQPQELYDMNINYMKYYNGLLTVDTEKTSQEEASDLSYINNVIAIQEVIRDVRLRCPKIRYTFTSGDGFTKYQKEINQILEKKTGFFDSLELIYLEDMAQTDNKCYFACIKVENKDFVESEYFKVSVI